jgi:putative DNA primase/helicase
MPPVRPAVPSNGTPPVDLNAARPLNRTDSGNAERFASQHRQDARYVRHWSEWIVWNGRHWHVDRGKIDVALLAKKTVRSILAEASKTADDKERKELVAWAEQSESRARRESMVILARGEPGVVIDHEELDRRSMLLSVQNGTLDLTTGARRQHRREDFLTSIAPVTYEPKALAPTWMQFLDRITDGNRELIDFLRRAVGYTLTGDVREQVLFFLHGEGANGKSTFCSVLADLLGRLAIAAAPSLLATKHGETHPTERADLCGSRAAICQEVEEGRYWAEVTIKQLTGGDRIKARRMHEDFWEFAPSHKLWIAGNHRPRIKGTDEAIWRRIMLVPFVVMIPPHERDKELPAKLHAELSGILNWALAGCLEWQHAGLDPPAVVREATSDYRTDEDTVGRFIDEMYEKDPDAFTPSSELYAAYRAWVAAEGERGEALSQRALAYRLEEKGFRSDRTKDARGWVGLRAKDGCDPRVTHVSRGKRPQ